MADPFKTYEAARYCMYEAAEEESTEPNEELLRLFAAASSTCSLLALSKVLKRSSQTLAAAWEGQRRAAS